MKTEVVSHGMLLRDTRDDVYITFVGTNYEREEYTKWYYRQNGAHLELVDAFVPLVKALAAEADQHGPVRISTERPDPRDDRT